MNRWTRRLAQGLSIAALGLVGCAQERAPINRVQPNALDKSFFVGEKLNDDSDNPVFYSRAFVIDQSVNQSDISVGLYSGTDRIKWEITEDALIARKGYQIAQGQDAHGVPGKVDGTIVAKYKIESHFDIKRSYNPQTGEELNIVEENTTDRPWQLRQYMRVDWSTNEVNDPMWSEMFFGKVFGDMTVEPLTYTVTDPTAEDAPHFEAKDGYFDITNKYYVAPGQTTMWGFTFPTCALVGLFTSTTTQDCNPQEATVRHSFWKVDPNHDYEASENTYRKMDVIASFGGAGDSFQPAFAGGTTQCWDPQYAYSDACFHQYLAKINFWEKSHADIACTDDTDADKDGTADACAAYQGAKGSQCDTVVKKCTIPLRDRHIATQGYWLNKETPNELLDSVDASGLPGDDKGPIQLVGSDGNPTDMKAAYKVPAKRGAMEDVVKSWNQLLTNALAYGREAECRRTGGTRDDCHAQYFVLNDDGTDKTQMVAFGGWGVPIAKVQPNDGPAALVACHAPVRDYDYQPVCGAVTETKCDPAKTDSSQCGGPGHGCNASSHCADQLRIGDQRKNVIFYWPWDSDAHYGGVAGLGQDPETGEEHGVSATVMGRSATRAAAVYRDYIQTAMYDFTVDDIANGTPQYVYNKILQNGYNPDSAMARKARGETVTYDAKPGNKIKGSGTKASNQYGQFKTGFSQAQLTQRLLDQKSMALSPALQNTTQPLWESMAAKLRGTPWEAQMVDPTWAMQAMGADPTKPVSGSSLEQASPFRGLDEGRLALWRAQIAGTLANKGICFVDDVPRVGSVNFQGLARWYMDKFHDLGMDTDVQTDPNTGLWVPGPRDPALVKQRGEYLYRELFHGMATGIAIHEVGHTLGMRHNFASSYDSMNYMPQYWQLRTHDGTASQACNGARDPNKPDTCMGPRFDDPMDTDEMGFAQPAAIADGTMRSQGRPAVGYFGNSTVMEYEQDYMSPGIAPYDFNYVNAVYGGVLETYDIDRVAQGGLDESAQGDFLPNLALQRSELWIEGAPDIHYTNLARDLKLFDASYCRDATPEELEQGQWRVVHGKICTQSPRDHWVWKDFSNDADDGVTPPTPYSDIFDFTAWHVRPDSPGYDGRDRQRWSYRYGETYGSGYLHTNYSDNGADPYEIITNQGAMFEATYPLTYFRHQNKEYTYFNIPSSTADRYFERMRSYHWILADQFSYNDPANTGVYEAARRETFNFLVRAAMAPEPGGMKVMNHYESSTNGDPNQAVQNPFYDVDSNNAVSLPADWQLPIMEGRYVGDDFSDKLGGQWDYLSWINHAGYAMERSLAMEALLDGRPTLYIISRETYLDGRNVMKNYRVDNPEGLDRLMGGVLSEQWSTVAPWVTSDTIADPAGGLPFRSLQQPNLLDATPTRPAGAISVFPNIGYKTQVGSMIFATLYSRMSSDMTLIKKMRVYVEGLDVIPGTIQASERIAFTDPNTGYTYVARKFGDDVINGVTVDKGIASRMIDHAAVLLAKKGANSADYLNYIGLLDATRQVGNLFLNQGPLCGTGTCDGE